MPYIWNRDEEPNHCLELWPYSSLPNKGFAIFILITFLMLNFPLYTLLGTKYFWIIFAFLFITLSAIWYALRKNYNDGSHQTWKCNSYWTKVSLHENGGPVPNYITLSGSGRVVEIGSFLSEPERKNLYGELVKTIKQFQSN